MEHDITKTFPNVKVQPHWLETLEAAAEVLPNFRWLCVAIELRIRPEIEEEIIRAVAQAIAPFGVVSAWLEAVTGKDHFAAREEALKYRTAWLNHMIGQCRAMQPNLMGEVS